MGIGGGMKEIIIIALLGVTIFALGSIYQQLNKLIELNTPEMVKLEEVYILEK